MNDGYKFMAVDKADLPKLDGMIEASKASKKMPDKMLVKFKAENEQKIKQAINLAKSNTKQAAMSI
jgi:hypothetical protein